MAYTIASPFGANVAGDLEPWMTDHLGWLVDALGSMFDPTWSIVSERGSDGDPGYVPGFGSLFDVDLCPTGALGYLGQFVGVVVPAGASDHDARALIRGEAGMARGTLASVASAVIRSISTPWQPNTAYPAGVLVSYNGAYYLANSGDVGSWSAGSATWAASTVPWSQPPTEPTFDAGQFTLTDVTSQFQIEERTNASFLPDAYVLTIVVRPEQLTPVGNTAALIANVNATKPAGIILNVIVADSTIWSSLSGAWSGLSGTWQQL